MASSDAHAFPIKNRAQRVTLPVYDSTGSLVTTGTTNVTISKDGAAFANPNAGATTATQIASSSGVWYVDLAAADLNCDTLIVKFDNTNGKPTIERIYPLTLVDPAAVPAFGAGGASLDEAVAWLLALSRNKLTQTSTTTTLRNDGDTANVATSGVSDDGTTFTRSKWA